MAGLRPFLRNGFMKTWPLYRSLLLKRLPDFIYSDRAKDLGDQIPVFVFHSVEPGEFEGQLRYLKQNGYSTISADELVDILHGTRATKPDSVVLTFDDGLTSQWTVAAPLLRRYGYTSTVFAIPRLVPDGPPRPTLETTGEVEQGGRQGPHRRLEADQLARWSELAEMSRSGVADIQSHTWNHDRVAVSPSIVDFVNPDFDYWNFGNTHVPGGREDGKETLERRVQLGMPIYRSQPRMRATRRYPEDERLRRACVDFVSQQGGERFFQRRSWEAELRAFARAHQAAHAEPEQFLAPEEVAQGIRTDLQLAKETLQTRLGREIRHLCYPWFEGSQLAVEVSKSLGYQSNFWGDLPGRAANRPGDSPYEIVRIHGGLLKRLPGVGRAHLTDLLWRELRPSLASVFGQLNPLRPLPRWVQS